MTSPAHEEQDYAAYSMPVDQTAARANPVTRDVEVFTFHEAFHPKPRLTKAEQRELAIKQAALRIAAGLEMRSLRALAAEIQCTHTALDNALLRLCDRVGMRKYHVSDTTRFKQSEARRKQLGSR